MKDMKMMKGMRFVLILILLSVFGQEAMAQYFGMNKPRYHELDFEVLHTPHFDVYSYLKNKEALDQFASDAENWYTLHKAVLQDSFSQNPILLYNDHADFQMTNAISSQVGIATGGVTEGLKNRLIMPLTFTNEQTNHVLGHEMVHVFQYHMMSNGGKPNPEAMQNIPLWMIEGLAEYLSIGRVDAHTAMWMRDAVLNEDVPSIKDLNSYKYFPYRYGQAFWAFLAGNYGDQVIRPFFLQTAAYGIDNAVQNMFGITRKEMSDKFTASLKDYYGPMMAEGHEDRNTIGRKIISGENSGSMNVSPSMSPDGRYIIFLSEKNLFSTDLYLASSTGKILKRLTKITRDGHVDDLSFIESAGTWSPNSKEFAYVAFDKGMNVLVIKETETAKTKEVIQIPGVLAISNPAWSPNGRDIVFTGLVEGQTDLYSYNLKSGRVKQLTDDVYSEIQASFNPEGTHITFATDKISMEEGRTHGKYKMNLAVMNLETGDVDQIRIFEGADNLNPSFDNEGNIIFLSDRDGFRNMYKYNLTTREILQMTQLLTGISGITKYSPAISVSRKKDRIIYTHYYRGDYVIHQSNAKKLLKIPVDKDDVNFDAATLPMQNDTVLQIVQNNLDQLDKMPQTEDTQKDKYRPKFQLDHFAGSTGVGVSSGSAGTRAGLAGGVSMLFSDLAGNHQIFATVAVNGSFQDIGGQLTYLNRKHRVAYGVQLSHMPQRYFVGSGFSSDTINLDGAPTPVDRVDNYSLTIFEEHVALVSELPLSKTKRIEANVGMTYRFHRLHTRPSYYYENGPYIGDGNKERVPFEQDEVNLGYYVARKGAFYNITAAFVGDNAQFGLTAPMNGYRYRFEVTKYVGTYDFLSTNIDMRAYQFLGPVSVAVRLQQGSRHGKDANSFNPMYIGYQGFVRGYNYNQLEQLVALNAPINDEISFQSDLTVMYRRMSGSKYIMSGFEIRMPFTGPEKLAKIKSKFLLTDLNFFFDIGAAFDEWSHFANGETIVVNRPGQGLVAEVHKPKIAMSTGVSLRVNLFNAMIVEPYFAYPLEKKSKFVFGFNFIPGW
jgi:Tol biopolymer transport system component